MEQQVQKSPVREIKFRAWHKELEDMGYSHAYENHVKYPGFYEIMQYTGLKDKNGKEIYEGDIVRKVPDEWMSKTDDSISLKDFLISIANIGLVEYSTAEFILTNKKYRDKIYDGYGHGSIEVIGNIYENPELL